MAYASSTLIPSWSSAPCWMPVPLQAMYSPNDGNTGVWYLRKVTATISIFTEPPKVYEF